MEPVQTCKGQIQSSLIDTLLDESGVTYCMLCSHDGLPLQWSGQSGYSEAQLAATTASIAQVVRNTTHEILEGSGPMILRTAPGALLIHPTNDNLLAVILADDQCDMKRCITILECPHTEGAAQ